MKISTLLSLAFACTVSASTYGQNYKLSMNKQDCSISEVLKEIEKNSEYTFFLNDNQVNVNRKTSVKANNASLEEVLEQALKNTGYQYEIVDRQIIIKSKSVSSVSHPNALFQSSPRKITGQVKDALGEPIIGANVVVKGTTNGTITDIDGNFSLEVPDNAILVVSYIGYTDRTVEVGNSSKVMVSLSEDTQKLDEVVVVGYGTQKKVNLTGAISSLDAETLENRPITNSTQALQGTQGVYVNQAGAQPVAGVANLVEMTYKAQAFHPTYTADGRYADTFIRTPGHNIYRHPLALADEGENKHKSLRMLANLSAEYKLPFDIVYNLNVGLNKYDYLQSRFAPDVYEYQLKTNEEKRVVYDGQNTRHAYKGDKNNLAVTVFNTLSWGKKFNDAHDVKVLAGYSFESDDKTEFSAKVEGFLGNELHELNAGSSNPSVAGTSSRSVLMSYFGRVNYGYKDRYLFEGNFRYDGSSRFAKGNRWGIFPSFSAGWRLSEEEFMKDIPWIYNLKLRASWGQLGNERIDLFRYVDLMNLKVIKNDGSITDYNYPLNGAMQSGAAITAYNDPNITWETTTMTNVGIDASLLNGNLDFSFEFFDKRTSDILRKVTLPDQVGGLDGPIRNIGEVSNKGFELNMGYRNNIGDFRYEVNGNMTFIKNKIVSLKGQTIIDGMFILEEGKPIDSYYMLHAIGIFQSEEEIKNSPYQTAATKPGYLKFEDTNGDGKITEDDRQIRGGVIPKITYGFNINLGYKDWDLSAFFQGVTDVYTYGDRIGATPLWFGCGLPEQWLTDAWTPERGTSATLPILTTYEGCLNENFRTNDFWLRNASYLRLKNLQLSYNVPVSFLKSGVVKRLKVFVNAQNLFTFSPMKDFDPEKNLKGSNWYAYPSVRTYTAGVNVTF